MTRIVCVQMSGIDTPERLYYPSIFAMTARAMMDEVMEGAVIYFLIHDVTVVEKGDAGVKVVDAATLDQLVLEADANMFFLRW